MLDNMLISMLQPFYMKQPSTLDLTLRRYAPEDKPAWNEFIRIAKNGMFLFDRKYMDYHGERFADHSLVAFKKKKIIAVFIASGKGREIIAHAGLTFGGAVLHPRIQFAEVVEIFTLAMDLYRNEGFTQLTYKAIPHTYHRIPAGEDQYALFHHNAVLVKRDISSVINLSSKVRFSQTKKNAAAKCGRMGVRIAENTDFAPFWALLQETLLSRYNTLPVHSLEEIICLKDRFERNIRLHEARLDGRLLAGVVIYDFGDVAHTQYMACSDEGRNLHALDFLNMFLVSEVYNCRKYYSFGTSSEAGGRQVNEGLLHYKEMLGGHGIIHDSYKIDLTKYQA